MPDRHAASLGIPFSLTEQDKTILFDIHEEGLHSKYTSKLKHVVCGVPYTRIWSKRRACQHRGVWSKAQGRVEGFLFMFSKFWKREQEKGGRLKITEFLSNFIRVVE